jgi:LacI family transcriptional regulator
MSLESPNSLTYIMADLLPQSAFARGVIAGAARYCFEHQNLRLRHSAAEMGLSGAHEMIAGVIAVVPDANPALCATRFGKPVVNVSAYREHVDFPTVAYDNLAIGRMAADHLLGQGYRHFAYHMDTGAYYSRLRLAGFRARLEEVGRDCDVFDTNPEGLTPLTVGSYRQATIDWLRKLPTPLGLFSHHDHRAGMLLDICREAGLLVPEQVGVLGTDNDELISATSIPTLSSIDPAADLVGYRAADLLVELINGRSTPTERLLIPPRRVVARESTQLVLLDDELLAKAVAFIRERATRRITVADVLAVVPLTRRSLERRFRDRLGRSPGEEIIRVKLDRAKWLLTETDQPMWKVATAAGFKGFRSFATAFRRELKMGPTAYRRSVKMR